MATISSGAIWDLCLARLYPGNEYVTGLQKLLADCGYDWKAPILDASCGTGFPAIDLYNKGYNITATDASTQMLARFHRNATKRACAESFVPQFVLWHDLWLKFGGHRFDIVMCRGNSLPYARSWGQYPARTQADDIMTALINFRDVLKPGGMLYVDCTSSKEGPHTREWSTYSEDVRDYVDVKWSIAYSGKDRYWTCRVYAKHKDVSCGFESISYLFAPGELVELLKTAGFVDVMRVDVPGEHTYDAYLARKERLDE